MIELDFLCDEPESSIEPRETGAYCRRCREPIVDLSLLTKKQALAVVREGERCVQYRTNASGEPVFRREPSALAPLGAMALSLITACGTSEEPHSLSPVAITAPPSAPPDPAAAEAPPVAIVPEPAVGEAPPPEAVASVEGVPGEKPALDYSQLPPDPSDCEHAGRIGARPHDPADSVRVLRGRPAPRPDPGRDRRGAPIRVGARR